MLATAIIFLLLVPDFVRAGSSDLPEEDPWSLNQEMKQFLDERVRNRSSNQRIRLKVLVSTVFRKGDLGFTYAPETRTAVETFTEKSGNCLSFTIMFLAMARYLGLNAKLREVAVAPTWSRRGRVVTYNRHVNVAIKMSGSTYVVDLFPRVDRIEIGGWIVSDERALAHFYSNKGAEQLETGDPALAAKYFRKALDLDPKADFIWANLGVALSVLGDLEESERSYIKALALNPEQMVAMGNLAKLYERVGRVEQAKRYLKKVESFQKKNPYYHFSLGEEAYRSKQFEEAVEHYKAALDRNSKEHHFHFALAKTFAQLGDLPGAVKHLEEARKYAPGSKEDVYSQKLELLAAQEASAKVPTHSLSTIE